MDLIELTYTPIGVYRCDADYPQQVPRQSTELGACTGVVELPSHQNFEMALRDLKGFARIWLISHFNQVDSWRPTVRPPIPPPETQRVSVFASRSPYRPNPVGISCVQLLAVRGRFLDVGSCDLLNNTPILDIKPYIPAFDSFPDSSIGWISRQIIDNWDVRAELSFATDAARLIKIGGPDIEAACRVQLSINPFDDTCKRIFWESPDDADALTGTSAQIGTFHFRAWAISVETAPASKTILLRSMKSSYTMEDLSDRTNDEYGDKDLHRLWESA